VTAGHDVQTDEGRARLERRDHLDSTREASPLGQADDAELLDTTGLTVEQVVDAIVARFEAAR
jgi:cytidylate kinase